VQSFQRSRRLTADGIVGSMTEAALLAAGAGTPPGLGPAPPAPGGPTNPVQAGGAFKDQATYARVPLAPVQPLGISSSWPSTRRTMAQVYNRVGGLISAIAGGVQVDVATVLAVWAVESGGLTHVPGAAVIRFENHKFFDLWGVRNPTSFDTYFKFGGRNGQPGQRWENHQFRTSSGAPFAALHVNQSTEYAALRHAIALGGEPLALQAISIGGPQILVSNYKVLGYSTPKRMYDAFQLDERWHVLGFFDFCRVNGILNHLTAKRWTDFASKYNGPGNATVYGQKIAAAYAESSQLPLPRPSAPPYANPSPSNNTPVGGPEPVVTVNPGVNVSANAVRVLKAILRAAGLSSATITSGRRDASEQARVMYNLIEANGVAYAKDLYGSNGDKVIDVYASRKAARNSADEIKSAMRSKIIELGPSNVSLHASESHDVFDVAPSSIANSDAFRRALDSSLAAGAISRYIPPPGDPAFHIEILLASENEYSVMEAPPLAAAVILQEAELAAQLAESEFERRAGRGRTAKPGAHNAKGRPVLGANRARPKPRPKYPTRQPPFRAFSSLGASLDAHANPPRCAELEGRIRQLVLLVSRVSRAIQSEAGPLLDGLRLDVDAIVGLLPHWVQEGCTSCHLSKLLAAVTRAPWPPDSGAVETKTKLLNALSAARAEALDDTTECR
jgi:hypothetical protein